LSEIRAVADARFLLDSNIGIYILQGNAPAAAARLQASELGSVVTSSICLSEMLIGLRAAEQRALESLLEQIAVMPFDDTAAHRYAALPFKRRGFDRLIAAHALALDLTVVTANVVDFADVPDLRVENWMVA
jgi:tRNA(fMet)-specific endonuclease VapC